MSDNILRGYCKKCEGYVEYEKKVWSRCIQLQDHDPVWLLSAKQIWIVGSSKEFQKWRYQGKNNYFKEVKGLSNFVSDEPFLIAKLLKEGEQK